MISIGMMLKDEQEYLDKCLNSLANGNYKYIVYDTGSGDSTLNILEHYGIEYIKYPFTNYSDVRNKILNDVGSGFVLMVDGDEAIVKEVMEPDDAYEAYKVNRCHYLGNGCVYYDKTIRLIRNGNATRYLYALYEMLNTPKEMVGQTDVLIHHFGYLKPTFMSKAARNIAIIEKQVHQDRRTVHYSMMSLYLLLLGKLDEAEKAIKEGMKVGDNIWFFVLLSDIYKIRKEYSCAMGFLEEAKEYISSIVDDKERNFYDSRLSAKQGIILTMRKKYEDALLCYEQIDDVMEYCKLLNLSYIYKKIGQKHERSRIKEKLASYPYESERMKKTTLLGEIISDVFSTRLEELA